MDLSSLTSKHHTINQPSPPTATVAGDIPSIGQPFTGLTPLYKPHNQAAALGGNPSTAALAGDTEAEVGEEAGKQGAIVRSRMSYYYHFALGAKVRHCCKWQCRGYSLQMRCLTQARCTVGVGIDGASGWLEHNALADFMGHDGLKLYICGSGAIGSEVDVLTVAAAVCVGGATTVVLWCSRQSSGEGGHN
ncbi:Hypothetical predicted protein [Olea europaea subsp. europaea]|uniref:Uncharacterized protein n=1 Tax=Olea europaea subsp. europaea TaxID=158383 RepID=A0A8S0P6V0_OLEEU|nr:Hypothetical predicted protein [Olea europaea subsp. europaea]